MNVNSKAILQIEVCFWKIILEKALVLIRETPRKTTVLALKWFATPYKMKKADIEHRRKIHCLMRVFEVPY